MSPNETTTSTVQATVYFKLSKEGQKAAILAGKPAAFWQSLTGPIDADYLDLCQILLDGSVVATTATTRSEIHGNVYSPSAAGDYSGRLDLELNNPPDSAAAVLRLMRKEIDQKAVEAAAKKAAEEVRAKERTEQQETEYQKAIDAMQKVLDSDPAAIPAVKLPEHVWRSSWDDGPHPVAIEIKRRKTAKDAADRAEKERVAAINATELRSLLAEYATGNVIERYDAGLLADDEMKRILANYIFEPLNKWPLYEKLTAPEVRAAARKNDEEYGCYDGLKAIFRSRKPDSLTADQWAQLKEMRAAVGHLEDPEVDEDGDPTVEPLVHEGSLEDDDIPWGVVERYGALAKAVVAGVEVRREYAL